MRLNQSGQSLVEYLLLLALMAVGTMAAVRVLNQNVNGKFAQVIDSVQGKQQTTKVHFEQLDDEDYKKKTCITLCMAR